MPVRYLLWGILMLCIIFGALILVIPLPLYRFIGNSFEVIAALVCMCLCLYAYWHWSGRIILLLAAFAFGEYALATIFWYLFSLMSITKDLGGRPFVFTTVAELSFLGFMIFFIAAFQIEQETEPVHTLFPWLFLALFLFTPLIVIGEYGITLRTVTLLVHFVIVEQLIMVTISHGFFRYRLIWSGICIWCLAMMLYGLRETLFLYYPSWILPLPQSGAAISVYSLLSIVGPLIIASFALIVLGLLDYVANRSRAGQEA